MKKLIRYSILIFLIVLNVSLWARPGMALDIRTVGSAISIGQGIGGATNNTTLFVDGNGNIANNSNFSYSSTFGLNLSTSLYVGGIAKLPNSTSGFFMLEGDAGTTTAQLATRPFAVLYNDSTNASDAGKVAGILFYNRNGAIGGATLAGAVAGGADGQVSVYGVNGGVLTETFRYGMSGANPIMTWLGSTNEIRWNGTNNVWDATSAGVYTFTGSQAIFNSSITASIINWTGSTGGSQIPNVNQAEYFGSTSTAFTNAGASSAYTDFVSTTLPAGNWVFQACGEITANGATLTADAIIFAGGTSAGNNTTGALVGQNFFHFREPTATNDSSMCTAKQLITASTTQTYYLKFRTSYSAGTPQFNGTLTFERKP